MVVISIISMLSSVSLVALNKVRIRAQVSRVQQELRQIGNAIIIVRDQSDKLLWEINSPPFPLPPDESLLTANFTAACTNECVPQCQPPNDLRNTTDTCYTKWAAVLDAIEANSGGIFPNLDGFRRERSSLSV